MRFYVKVKSEEKAQRSSCSRHIQHNNPIHNEDDDDDDDFVYIYLE